ncbi:unnamed protein product [Porites evermanni]|uniref:F5/8 type C domain-containing protein n=1 Tax=Porites evermanni TaxID=104178 RepID=A0ABN8LCQ0_9CNID|nr:unnamed protein product [Porites evermanni]
MESRKINDGQIRASTVWNAAHGATNGRLNFKAGGGKTGAWSSLRNDVHQWLQVNLVAKTEVTGIQIQGRQDTDQWVTSFTISYSGNGTAFTPYQNSEVWKPIKVFNGNTDRNTVVLNVLHPSINARYIRAHPKTWRGHISMRMELLGCPSACLDPLGMESRKITDGQITASTVLDAAHGATNGRLNFKAGGGKTGAWSALRNDVHQWLQVNLGAKTEVTGIQIQGRQDVDQWVTSFTISYSSNGTTYTPYQNSKVFNGNTDRNTVVLNILHPPVDARYVRAHPKTWRGHISMRMELLGCPSGTDNLVPACLAPLGMESRKITDGQITASTVWNAAHGATNGRLNFKAGEGRTGAWSSLRNDVHQWLQVDLGAKTEVTRIQIQGRQDFNQWVTSFTISYSGNGTAFTPYQNSKVFNGNTDRNTVVLNVLHPSINARYIRVHPKTWRRHISMRMELLGCPSACLDPLGMESRKITDGQITASTVLDAAHGATNGRLNFKAGAGKTGAWSALKNDVHQWLQVGLGAKTEVTGIQIQGRQDADQWVTSFTISYSSNGTTYTPYQNSKVFNGNTDRNTVVLNVLHPSIDARYIRAHPKAWRGHISMRMELLGCPSACLDPLGMESRKIADGQITASTVWNAAHGATNGRLNFKAGGGKTGAWSTLRNDVHQWLQVNLGAKTEVTGVQIQGRQDTDQWVTSFTISYSGNGTAFTPYQNSKVFNGNTDRNTVVLNVLHPSINARYIRVHPKTWRRHISMRMELLGCPSACLDPLGMESRKITDGQITASTVWNAAHGATNGRLNFKAGGSKTGAWSALRNDVHQWLQVDLGAKTEVTGIQIQGRQDADQWVTSFTISYSGNGTAYTPYQNSKVWKPIKVVARQTQGIN